MSYVNMTQMLQSAKLGGYAVGAFNIVDYITAEAVIQAAANKKAPIIIQTSAKTVTLYGYSAISNWIKTLAQEVSVPVALHLDHCKDLEMIRQCMDAGWSSVMIDASSYPLNENIALTKQVVSMALCNNVSVEGELGAIVGVEDDIFVHEQDSHLADPEACYRFVQETGVDVLAPAIGTAHGVYKKKPDINLALLRTIAAGVDIPLAIHGGTGLSPEVFKACIKSGGAKVNISTNLKHLFKDALVEYYATNPEDYEPVNAIKFLRNSVIKAVEEYIELFGSCNKA